MTTAMPDSIHVPDLPNGYPAYLGYADGSWPTAGELEHRFPGAHLLILTVTGTVVSGADGCDCERLDLTPATAAGWVTSKLAAEPSSRPVVYASPEAPGYRMSQVISELTARGISRNQVRLLSAHYGAGEHICGPATCKLTDVPMDGTQWTSSFWTGTASVDMSVLTDGFFTGTAPVTPTEAIVQQLPELAQGATGAAVRTVQGLCQARGQNPVIDGIFGQYTKNAVMNVQHAAGITQDGIVGPKTWPVLLGVA
jgi:hypothetical protein